MSWLIAIAVALALAVTGTAVPSMASAENLDMSISDAEAAVKESQLSLDEAKQKLDRVTGEYDAITAEIDSMQAEIDATAKKVMDAQERMLKGRESLSETVRQEYRKPTISMFVDVILGSESLDQMTKSTQAIDQIMEHHTQEVAEQRELKRELDEVADELTAKKDEQEDKLVELEKKKTEAEQIVSQVSSELDENSANLEALKNRANELKKQQEQQVAQVTVTAAPGAAGSPSEGWRSGQASAYGGSSDPWTPNPGMSATGARVDDNSMGVAIPLSWANRNSYYNRTIQIVYNGRTVYATINDCGGMDGVVRHLDLQPGVFKAFGFPTCQAWGVRTVQYRIL